MVATQLGGKANDWTWPLSPVEPGWQKQASERGWRPLLIVLIVFTR